MRHMRLSEGDVQVVYPPGVRSGLSKLVKVLIGDG